MKKISLFTPCYNEEGNVRNIYEAVTKVMETMPQYDYEYIFIDNCSQDKTPEILKEIAEKDKHVKVIFNLKNFGPGRSGYYGFLQTTGDVSICMACDLQDPPELIPEFIKRWEQGYKVVWGQKEGSEESKFMYFIRGLYYKIIKLFSDEIQIEQVTGFGLYDREVMDLIRSVEEPDPILRNLIMDFGYEISLIQYKQPKRKAGKSSYNFIKYFSTALNSLVSTSSGFLRIATLSGFFISGISFLIGLYYLIMKLIFWDSFVMGTAPIMIGLFFLGSVQLFFIGIIGEYIGVVLKRLTKRPLVVEKERLNFDKNDEEVKE